MVICLKGKESVSTSGRDTPRLRAAADGAAAAAAGPYCRRHETAQGCKGASGSARAGRGLRPAGKSPRLRCAPEPR